VQIPLTLSVAGGSWGGADAAPFAPQLTLVAGQVTWA
jgi:hypothetical protein